MYYTLPFDNVKCILRWQDSIQSMECNILFGQLRISSMWPVFTSLQGCKCMIICFVHRRMPSKNMPNNIRFGTYLVNITILPTLINFVLKFFLKIYGLCPRSYSTLTHYLIRSWVSYSIIYNNPTNL